MGFESTRRGGRTGDRPRQSCRTSYSRLLTANLISLFSSDPPCRLDLFISQALVQADVWDCRDDGIYSESEAWSGEDRYALRGWISHIDQTLHPFWLELAQDKQGGVSWLLGLDIVARSPKRARDVFDAAQRFEEIEWQFELAGEATIEVGRLEIVYGSIRLRARDPAPPAPGRVGRRPRPPRRGD